MDWDTQILRSTSPWDFSVKFQDFWVFLVWISWDSGIPTHNESLSTYVCALGVYLRGHNFWAPTMQRRLLLILQYPDCRVILYFCPILPLARVYKISKSTFQINFLLIMTRCDAAYFVRPGVAPIAHACDRFRLFIRLLLPVLGKPTTPTVIICLMSLFRQ